MSVTYAKGRLEIRHTVDAPLDDVFDAWTLPHLLETWWGPEGYRTVVEKLEARTGGMFIFRMTAPSGASCPMAGTYIEVSRPTSLSFEVVDHCVADMPGTVRPPSRPSRVDIQFQARGDKTDIVLVQTGLAQDYQILAEVGWDQSLERLGRLSTGAAGDCPR
ncbi:MAG: SRPBCC domain-containing protein [Rhodospirillales bacterium]|nr:SRPBCC domain-containing protein [Rhodospirillales bacterium]